MNLPDLTESIYLNSSDFLVGTTFPPMEIVSVEKKKAPSGKGDKVERGVITLAKCPKPWMCSSVTTLRQIGAVLGMKAIEKTWIGGVVTLKVVAGVRRPDGTVGNAFRVADVRKGKAEPAPGQAGTAESDANKDAPK